MPPAEVTEPVPLMTPGTTMRFVRRKLRMPLFVIAPVPRVPPVAPLPTRNVPAETVVTPE